jgi:hypothetical protein
MPGDDAPAPEPSSNNQPQINLEFLRFPNTRTAEFAKNSAKQPTGQPTSTKR